MKDDRLYTATLLFLAFVFAYADRGVVNVLLPAITTSFHLTLVQASLLQGMAFSLLFAIAGIPLGRVADRSNRRNLLAIGIAVWSIATIWCGLASSFWELFAARMAVGVGEACLLPASASLLADTYPPAKRGRAISFVQSGTPVGTLSAMVGGGWLLTWLDSSGALAKRGIDLDNWQVAFIALGAPGLILAAMLLGIREPVRKEAPRREASSAGVTHFFKANLPALVSFFLFQAGGSMGAYAILSWAPAIYMKTYGLSAGVAGTIVGGMLLVCSLSAYFMAGVASDAMVRRRPRTGRVIVPGLALPVGIAAFAWLYFTDGATTSTIAMAVALFASTFWSTGALPALQAVAPNRLRGQTVAIMFLVINLLGLGATPTLVAAVADPRGGMQSGLQPAVAIVGLGVVVVGLLLWPLVIRTYGAMRNYEIEEFDDSTLEAAAELGLQPSNSKA
jgi:MFS family permease